MEVRSIYKNARISPKKARDVAREIQGLPVSDAIDTLNFTPKKAAFLIGKTLKSAVANAENNHDLAADSLHVKEANISAGPSFRRYKPRARGSASPIRKRTSHIYIILTDEVESDEKPVRERKPRSKKPAPEQQETEPEKEETAPEESDEVATAEEAPVAGQDSDVVEENAEGEADETPEEVNDEPSEVADAAEEEPEGSSGVEEAADEEEKKED